jgi:hypothetical protein
MSSVSFMLKANFRTFIDSLSFRHIFAVWLASMLIFGLAYHFAADTHSYLVHSIENTRITGIIDSVYFSFVTATTTGFGDIVPMGNFKSLAIIEVLISLMMVALVTSKFVSIRQDVILGEVYEISFNERMYRLRSSLILFRQHLERLMAHIEDGSIKKREIAGMYVHFSIFEDTLREAITLIGRAEKNQYIKSLDEVNAELILGSVMSSLEKAEELIKDLNRNKLEWKNDCNVKCLRKSLSQAEKLLAGIELDHEDVAADMKQWLDNIKTSMEKQMKGYRVSRRRKC